MNNILRRECAGAAVYESHFKISGMIVGGLWL